MRQRVHLQAGLKSPTAAAFDALLLCAVDKIVGIAAPADFVDKLEDLAGSHHELLVIDVIRVSSTEEALQASSRQPHT